MEKIFITIVVSYALFVGIYLLRLKVSKRQRKNIVGEGSTIQEIGRLKSDIVGKSQFDLREAVPIHAKAVPVHATPLKSEIPPENTNTFVPLNEVKPTVEVPQEELDETFSDTPPDDEDNEPMDIDYSLEYETPDENEDEPEDEDEEVEGTAQAALASGVQFDDLGNMVRTISKTDEATPEQKKKAGDTLMEIRQTDMFEQVVSAKPDAKRIVTDLMAESLAAFHERKDKEAGTTGSSKKAPDSFNIRDFASKR